ncbi:MAG: nucleoside triphosphate pyrophosphohydrolase, partial [Clostridia bacterium]|nr:nucleoside triphosphate pyrophosphohydrolase [Clostridia bacterium]
DLLEIVRLLRLPDGCPWDREQTHKSIRSNLLEESYEVIDAIDREDCENLREELGDLLLQVVMHAQMEREEDRFDFSQVVHDVAYKLVERHPHVFGNVIAQNGEQALDSWEAVKRQTKNQETVTQTLESIPKAFPGLMRAQKVQKRAAKAGFDWDEISGALEKVKEEADELLWATEKNAVEELGDLLFSVVNVSRFLGIDSEMALQSATDKFITRFAGVEELALERGLDMKTASLEELDKLWDEVKQRNSR